MAGEPQLLFDLFDSYWFSHQIFNKSQNPPPKSPKFEEQITKTTQNLVIAAVPTINVIKAKESDETVKNKNISINININNNTNRSGRRRKTSIKSKSKSKSLPELEFEELKGFMDLGFSFTEKDKDSSLVSMIPGLQRLGEDYEDHVHGYVNVSRPYLSEAWDELEKIKEEAPRLIIRLPVIGNESDIKHQLKFWAHSVASVVR